eukprot:CAMPEP_0201704544 /NCGR_PEP_ID=MMETSP0578-20130828/43081_1 /ASSEMBLY_ACC=CAM_ASM_000663 /TAXON_ID=267565 /ORGANISM="Skeletonema grethea, Strain CCMP 1804" /LENGTH=59 /DNA_ID=CAMNT_0048192589 /DNA_START=28 /DNA_END=207 /DNA_ORIENTATION=+
MSSEEDVGDLISSTDESDSMDDGDIIEDEELMFRDGSVWRRMSSDEVVLSSVSGGGFTQ